MHHHIFLKLKTEILACPLTCLFILVNGTYKMTITMFRRFLDWEAFDNEAEIEIKLASLTFNTTSLESLRGAIVFQDGLADLAGTLRYKIRLVSQFDTQLLFPWFQLPGPNGGV